MSGEQVVVLSCPIVIVAIFGLLEYFDIDIGFGPCAGPPSEQKKLAAKLYKWQPPQ